MHSFYQMLTIAQQYGIIYGKVSSKEIECIQERSNKYI